MGSKAASRVTPWLGWVVAGVLLALVGAAFLRPPDFLTGLLDSRSEPDHSAVVFAVTKEEEVVLVSLGIQGLLEQSASSAVLGVDIPGSGRSSFVQYRYSAQLGIDGADVVIEELAPHEYRISIPEFVFIGHDDEEFDLAVEDNGALSWITPEIDPVEMINEILDEGTEREHVAANTGILQQQASSFYRGIVLSVDPDSTVDFVFADGTESPLSVD